VLNFIRFFPQPANNTNGGWACIVAMLVSDMEFRGHGRFRGKKYVQFSQRDT